MQTMDIHPEQDIIEFQSKDYTLENHSEHPITPETFDSWLTNIDHEELLRLSAINDQTPSQTLEDTLA